MTINKLEKQSIRPLDKQTRPSQGFPNSDKTKIGYIKINSIKGQVTFTVFEIFGGVLYNTPNLHRENIKNNNIVHLNVKTDIFMDHASQIKQHIRMLIRVFLGLNYDDFKLVMHEFK